VSPSTRNSRATRANCSLRVVGLWHGVAVAVMLATAACGSKGPPLAPFVRVPATVSTVTGQRIGNDVYLSFAVPSTNVDGRQPADIASLEVYAVTSTRPPVTEEQREVATLVAAVPVRPILPELPVPANGSAPPPIPLPPGVERGATAVVRETLTPELLLPVELPDRTRSEDTEKTTEDTEAEPFGPLVAPPPALLPRRHYFVVGVSPRGRKSDPSTPIAVPLDTVTSAPGAPKIDYTETQMTITWTPPADARTSTFLLPPAVKSASAREGSPPQPAVNASPSTMKPRPVLAPLPARSLGFSTEATTYHVYDVSSNASPADPYAIVLPAPLTPQPLPVTEHVIPAIAFGVERCFEVRPVDKVGEALVIGPASPRTCLTPVDRFEPAPPRSLAAIAGSGSINLIWDANTESDLAGYLVLRAEAPSDTLQPITKEPVTAAAYRDETVRAGVRYVYAVVAVDRAGNRSAESNRQEETAR
jgi:hypothetical protein